MEEEGHDIQEYKESSYYAAHLQHLSSFPKWLIFVFCLKTLSHLTKFQGQISSQLNSKDDILNIWTTILRSELIQLSIEKAFSLDIHIYHDRTNVGP